MVTMDSPTNSASLRKVQVYMHPVQHRQLRLLAAKADVSMSEYIKRLIQREAHENDVQG